jgi:hypothetical protein
LLAEKSRVCATPAADFKKRPYSIYMSTVWVQYEYGMGTV